MTIQIKPKPSQLVLTSDGNSILKTQPYYSIFFDVEQTTDQNIKNQLNQTDECNIHNVRLLGKIAATKKNMAFMATVCFTTIIIGTLTFTYWSHLLSMQQEDKVLEARSVYLSIFFLIMTTIMALMMYEVFSLSLSYHWFQKNNNSIPFYTFITDTRKIVVWVFMLLWLVIVSFTTAILAKRAERFNKLIVYNIVSAIILLGAQYIYYKTTNPRIQTFAVALSTIYMIFLVILLFVILQK